MQVQLSHIYTYILMCT